MKNKIYFKLKDLLYVLDDNEYLNIYDSSGYSENFKKSEIPENFLKREVIKFKKDEAYPNIHFKLA